MQSTPLEKNSKLDTSRISGKSSPVNEEPKPGSAGSNRQVPQTEPRQEPPKEFPDPLGDALQELSESMDDDVIEEIKSKFVMDENGNMVFEFEAEPVEDKDDDSKEGEKEDHPDSPPSSVWH